MSVTRAWIARHDPAGHPAGVYLCLDGYPSGIGKWLWQMYRRRYDHDAQALLQAVIDAHPAGWYSIVGTDWTRTPGYVGPGVNVFGGDLRPQCLCCGQRREPPHLLDGERALSAGCQYGYVIDPERHTLRILKAVTVEARLAATLGRPGEALIWEELVEIDLAVKESPRWSRWDWA